MVLVLMIKAELISKMRLNLQQQLANTTKQVIIHLNQVRMQMLYLVGESY